MGLSPDTPKGLSSGVIVKRVTVSRYDSNCYIVSVGGSGEALIIDPGGEADAILGYLRETGLTGRLIVATHLHRDHYGALEDVKRATAAPFAVHAAEVSADSRSLHRHPLPEPDRMLEEGELLVGGDLRLLVIHTPGHTAGSICLRAATCIFTGDSLPVHSMTAVSAGGRCGTFRDRRSLRTVQSLPAQTVIYPGHGPETTVGAFLAGLEQEEETA